jgi:hypothetical protein
VPQIGKAPSTGHPARTEASEPVVAPAPRAVPDVNPPPAREERLVNFGGRIRETTRKRMRLWAVENDRNLQDLLDQVCTEWLDSHGG